MSRSSGRGARSRVPNAGGMCSQRLLFPNGSLLGLQHGFPSRVDLPFLTFFHNLSFPTSAHVRVRRGAHAPRQAETQMRQEDPLRQLRPQRMHVHMSKRCVQISRLPVWGRVLFVLCYHRARLTRRHRIVHLGANNFFHRKPLCRPRHKVRACFPPCARAQTSPRSPDALEGGGGRGRGNDVRCMANTLWFRLGAVPGS